MPEAPLTITVYDKAFNRLGWIGDPEQVTVTPRHNQQPTASIQVRNDHPMVPALIAEGSRVVIDYHGVQTLAGWVDLRQGTVFADGSVTVQIQDYWAVLAYLLGWPVPTAAISTQTAAAYDVRSGAAETVLKGYVAANATRQGIPLTVATDQGRGDTISASVRMQPLADVLNPLIDAAGIGVTVRQSGAGLVLDCYEPAWFPLTLTPESGMVTAAEWSRQPPGFTRFVAGGQGDLTARTFRASIDSTAETLWGFVREGYVDATNDSSAASVQASAAQSVAESAAKSGLSLTLAETDTFRYGDTLRVGDLVTTELVPGVTITDVLREATISWSHDDGLNVTPTVGDRTDDPDRAFAKALKSVALKLSTYVSGR